MPPSQICVARIGAAHGVRGAVKLWTFTEDPLAVTRYGQLMTKDGARQFEVTHVRPDLLTSTQPAARYLVDRLRFGAERTHDGRHVLE